MIGTILHSVANWDERLPLAFGVFALAYGAASLVIYRFVGVPKVAL
jgi:DHA2 family methylenomycin A resistance protein-like MFS transporter